MLNLGRIWSKVQRTEKSCWLWPGLRNPWGYGIAWYQGKQHLAHRLAWENFHGREPGEKIVMHSCDNPPCVNPDHLILGTRDENNKDMFQKGRGCNPPRHIGESHPQAKLTKEQAKEVFQRRDNGEPLRVLAEEFGMTEQAVYLIHKGENWASATAGLTRKRKPKPVHRLTPEVIRQIFLRRKNGESPRVLSSEYDVNLATISKIYNRHHHREITEGLS